MQTFSHMYVHTHVCTHACTTHELLYDSHTCFRARSMNPYLLQWCTSPRFSSKVLIQWSGLCLLHWQQPLLHWQPQLHWQHPNTHLAPLHTLDCQCAIRYNTSRQQHSHCTSVVSGCCMFQLGALVVGVEVVLVALLSWTSSIDCGSCQEFTVGAKGWDARFGIVLGASCQASML